MVINFRFFLLAIAATIRGSIITFSIAVVLVLNGCGVQIRYSLNEEETPKSKQPIPMKVQVAEFTDLRNSIEKDKDERDKTGQSDLSDYTYDTEFQGTVAEEITQMLVDHLNFSKAFSNAIKVEALSSQDISDTKLDALYISGVEGVLTGDVIHFYGYYDQSLGRKILYAVPLGVASGLLLNWTFTTAEGQYMVYWYGPGLWLGYYLESLHSRHIEYQTLLHTKLISTSTHQIIWEEDFDVSFSGEKKIPGINTEQRKFEVAIISLRDAVNKMIADLSKNSDVIMQRKDQSSVQMEQRERPPIIPSIQQKSPIATMIREKGFRLGIVGGVNIASISGYENGESKALTGFSVGGRLSYRFSDALAIRMEIAYSTKGSKFKYEYESTFFLPPYSNQAYSTIINGTTNLSYLDIPVLLDYYPVKNLKIFAGTCISFFLEGEDQFDGLMNVPFLFNTGYPSDLTKYDTRSTDIGFLLGAGYSFGIVDIETRYSIGLTDHTKSDLSNLKNNVFQIIVGLNF